MIDLFIIFTKTGLVLFTHQLSPTAIKGNPVEGLIRTVLLEGRSNEKAYVQDPYAIKWTLANEFGLVFAAVYHKILAPLYVDDLLAQVVKSFTKAHGSQIVNATGPLEYEKEFLAILSRTETSNRRGRGRVQKKPMPKSKSKTNGKGQIDASERKESDEDESDDGGSDNNESSIGDDSMEKQIEAARARLERRVALRNKNKGGGSPKTKNKSGNAQNSKRTKEKRVWGERELSKEEAAALDRSNYSPPDAVSALLTLIPLSLTWLNRARKKT